ncbi:suppressor of ferric uptake [Acrasis kona]|uniref:Suppressor of ferric uptake n=1 Tax=Acrasis kona TaxID=1008807 RepID=A0AAW2ZH71_9EUKA
MSDATPLKIENTDQKDQTEEKQVVKNMPLMTLQLPTRHLQSPSLGSPMDPASPLPVPMLSITTDRQMTMSPLDTKKNKNLAFRECSNCYTADSPIWRKGPNDDKFGLYWSRHNRHRPIQITRTRVKKSWPETTLKQNRTGSPRPNSPRINSPRLNSPRVNSPRLNSPRLNSPVTCSPLTRVNSPLIAAASHVENSVGSSGKFAYEEDNSSNLMLLLEAVHQSSDKNLDKKEQSAPYKQEVATEEKKVLTLQDPSNQMVKRRRMLDINGSAFKAVVRELTNEDGSRTHSPPKMLTVVDRVMM